MKWISLKFWYASRYGAWNIHGRPIYVNMTNALYIMPEIGRVILNAAMASIPVMERPEENYTSIVFGADSGDGLISINVIETPEEIFFKLGE